MREDTSIAFEIVGVSILLGALLYGIGVLPTLGLTGGLLVITAAQFINKR